MDNNTSKIEFFHKTDKGLVREQNEDAIGFWQYKDGVLFAVADGLGAHNAGEVASNLALEVLAREMNQYAGTGALTKNLKQAVHQANLEIYQKAITVPELYRMGAAFIASVLAGSTLVTAHIGDCRLYLLRDGSLEQLTKDHTWVGERVQYGILSPEEARTHPNRHVLTRYLGYELLASIDFLKIDVKPGDVLVQCSDGIHSLLPDPEIAGLLMQGSPEASGNAIIRQALDAGGTDNMSLQIAKVISCGDRPVQPSWWKFW